MATARPSTRQNRFFWELITAFMLVVSAAVFQTFHFSNNAWLVQTNGSFVYQVPAFLSKLIDKDWRKFFQ